MADLAEDIPKGDWGGRIRKTGDLQLRNPLLNLGIFRSGLGDARKIALHIRHEDGNADAAEIFGQNLEAHGFSGSRGSREKGLAIGHGRKQGRGQFSFSDNEAFQHRASWVKMICNLSEIGTEGHGISGLQSPVTKEAKTQTPFSFLK